MQGILEKFFILIYPYSRIMFYIKKKSIDFSCFINTLEYSLKQFKTFVFCQIFCSLESKFIQGFQKVRQKFFLARVVRFELTHVGVRVRCLTAWRYPNI